MPPNRLRSLLAAVGPPPGDGLPDADLLARFADARDEAAFEALVWRHGPMVRAVCRHVLGPRPEADDAFQATFLVLARKAGVVRARGAVGGWLYTVAGRVARKLRRQLARREPTVEDLTMVPDADSAGNARPPSAAEAAELRAALEAEIARLPEKYRLVVQLCYAAGHTTAEAGRRLGVPKGTILTRLAWARRRLQDRLARRGVSVGVGAFAAALGGSALDPQLVRATVRAAASLAGGATLIPQPSFHLSEGVIRDMAISKLKTTVGALLVAVAATGVGVGRWAAPAAAGAGDDTKPAAAKKADTPRATPPMPTAPANPDKEPADAKFEALQQQVKAMQDELKRLRESEKSLTRRLEENLTKPREMEPRQFNETAPAPVPVTPPPPAAGNPPLPPIELTPPAPTTPRPAPAPDLPPAPSSVPVARTTLPPAPEPDSIPLASGPPAPALPLPPSPAPALTPADVNIPSANPEPGATGKQYVVSRPVGDWHRSSAGHRFSLKFNGDRLVATNLVNSENGPVTVTIDADYSISPSGVVYGFITGIDYPDGAADLDRLVDTPFSFRFRAEDGVLTIKDVKLASKAVDDSVLFVAGRYSDKPLGPAPPRSKLPTPRAIVPPAAAPTPAAPKFSPSAAPPAPPSATPSATPGADPLTPPPAKTAPKRTKASSDAEESPTAPGTADERDTPPADVRPPAPGRPPAPSTTYYAPKVVYEAVSHPGPVGEPQADPFRRPDGSNRLLRPGNSGHVPPAITPN